MDEEVCNLGGEQCLVFGDFINTSRKGGPQFLDKKEVEGITERMDVVGPQHMAVFRTRGYLADMAYGPTTSSSSISLCCIFNGVVRSGE
jgi:hypothetical protein